MHLVPPPAVSSKPSEFIRGIGTTTPNTREIEFSQLSGSAEIYQPISNVPMSIESIVPSSPVARKQVDSHAISEQFVPDLSHNHVFWWMGRDPAGADTQAWEDPFPFVTFDYLPHVVSVPENPEP